MKIDNMTTDQCNRKIFDSGSGICAFHCGSAIAEAWVKMVAKESGQKVDWHYSGGMVNVLYIGNYAKVLAAIIKLKSKLDEACLKENRQKYQISEGVSAFRIFSEGSRGLYRDGDIT